MLDFCTRLFKTKLLTDFVKGVLWRVFMYTLRDNVFFKQAANSASGSWKSVSPLRVYPELSGFVF